MSINSIKMLEEISMIEIDVIEEMIVINMKDPRKVKKNASIKIEGVGAKVITVKDIEVDLYKKSKEEKDRGLIKDRSVTRRKREDASMLNRIANQISMLIDTWNEFQVKIVHPVT